MLTRLKNKIKLHSWHILIILVVATLLVTLLLGIFVQRNEVVRFIDANLYRLIAQGPHPAWLNAIVNPFNFNFLPRFNFLPPAWQFLPSYLYFMIIGVIAYVAIKKRPQVKWLIFTLIFASLYTQALYDLITHFVFRERPFLSLPHNLNEVALQAWSKLPSYPSGHSRDTALYATIIAAFIPQLRWPLFAFCIFIGWSRVYLGAHFPTDAAVGLVFGYVCAKASLMVSREIQLTVEKRRARIHGTHPMTPAEEKQEHDHEAHKV